MRAIHIAATGPSPRTVGVGKLVANGGTLFAEGEVIGTLDLGGGPFASPAGMPVQFLAAYDVAGAFRWNHPFVGLDYRSVVAMAARPGGGVVLLGLAAGKIDLGFGPSDGGDHDVWMAAFDDDGHGLWMRRFGTLVRDAQVIALAVAPEGTVSLFLAADAPVDFGLGPLPIGPVLVTLDAAGNTTSARGFALADDLTGASLATSPSGETWLATTYISHVPAADTPPYVGLLSRIGDTIATTTMRAMPVKHLELRAAGFGASGKLFLTGRFGGLSGPVETSAELPLGTTTLESPPGTSSLFVARATVR